MGGGGLSRTDLQGVSFASFSKDPIISEESTKGVKAMLYQSTQQVRREAAHGRGDGEQPDPWIEKHATMMAGRILRNETSSRRVQMSIQEMTVERILFVEDSDGTKQRRHAQKLHIDRLVHDARERMARRPDAPVSLQGLYGEVGWRKPSTILTYCLNDPAVRPLYNFPVEENAIAVVMTSEDHVKFCDGRNFTLPIGEMAMMMGCRHISPAIGEKRVSDCKAVEAGGWMSFCFYGYDTATIESWVDQQNQNAEDYAEVFAQTDMVHYSGEMSHSKISLLATKTVMDAGSRVGRVAGMTGATMGGLAVKACPGMAGTLPLALSPLRYPLSTVAKKCGAGRVYLHQLSSVYLDVWR